MHLALHRVSPFTWLKLLFISVVKGQVRIYLLVEPVVSGANRESVPSCPCGRSALSRCSVDMEALQFSSGAALVSCRHLGSCFGIVMRRLGFRVLGFGFRV
jgi:hypothetical protein